MFDDKSRYKDVPTYEVIDPRGRRVRVVAVPEPPQQENRGVHLRKEGQRLDHIAYRYLADGTAYWRIAEHAEAMSAEQLAEALEIPVPRKGR